MAPPHTYDHACRLAPVVEPIPDNPLLDGIPPIHAQFFYYCPISVDDPLSDATVAAGPEHKPSKAPLRPFSHADNNTLERAWLQLSLRHFRSLHQTSLAHKKSLPRALATAQSDTLDRIVFHLVQSHREKHSHDVERHKVHALPDQPPDVLTSTATSVCCQELPLAASSMLRNAFCEVTRRKHFGLDQEHVVGKVMAILQRDCTTAISVPPRVAASPSTSFPRSDGFVITSLSTSVRGRASSLASTADRSRSASTDGRLLRSATATLTRQSERPQPEPYRAPTRPPAVDDGIAGKSFVRVGTDTTESSYSESVSLPGRPDATGDAITNDSHGQQHPYDQVAEGNEAPRAVNVPVGISRLHMVSLPALQMKPIYWSPINDIAIVSRATWFYR